MEYRYVSSAVKGVIKSTVGDCDKVVLNLCPLWQCSGVDEIGGTHFLGPYFFARISIDSNYTRSLDKV